MKDSVKKLFPPLTLPNSEITIPGSKSYTNRALILASLCEGESRLVSASLSDDSQVLIKALESLGVKILVKGDQVLVQGKGKNLLPFKGEINIGPAGTALRFLVSVCAITEGAEIILSGSERMHERPIDHLVNAWNELGAEIDYLKKEGCPPLKILGNGKIQGGTIEVSGSVSSQYFSSLLMVAGLLPKGLEIKVQGDQISRSYIDMTIDSMRAFGLNVENHDYKRYIVAGDQRPKACEYQVEGDASGASYFWGLAALSGGKVRVKNVNPNSAQGDIRFPDILSHMGCEVRSGKNGDIGWIEVQGNSSLIGVNVDMTLMPDTAQSLAVVAAVAQNETRITGLGTLRIKETDRISALEHELAKLGVRAVTGPDYITIYPSRIHGARIKTYDDHRMAMSFAMLAGKFTGIEIEEPEVVNKSFPEFWDKLKSLGIHAEG